MRVNKNNKKVKDFDISDEESNIHLTQLKGKIIRNSSCPLAKTLPCEGCEFYDGWGINIKNYEIHVYCNNPKKIINGKGLKLIDIKELKEKKRRERREKTFKNTPMGRSKIPSKAGEYMFLDNRGNDVSNGWRWANNLNRRIREKHYDKTKEFSFIKIRVRKKRER